MPQIKKYASNAEKAKAYRERKKQAMEQQHKAELAALEKQLYERDRLEFYWEKLKSHLDLGPEYVRMELNWTREGIPRERVLKLKQSKIAEAITRGELIP